MVDGIKIQDEVFGLNPVETSGYYARIDLKPGETVESITYGRHYGNVYGNLPCRLSFQTNRRKFGPFSWSDRCPSIYHVDIPPEKPLGVFFKEDARTRRRENEKFVFDGFKSEYRIETEK